MKAVIKWNGVECSVICYSPLTGFGPTVMGVQGANGGIVRLKDLPEQLRIDARSAAWRAQEAYHKDFIARCRAISAEIEQDIFLLNSQL